LIYKLVQHFSLLTPICSWFWGMSWYANLSYGFIYLWL